MSVFQSYKIRHDCLRSPEIKHVDDLGSEIARCEREMAEAEALLRAGHPDVAGLCLALHDWAQELQILQRERGCWPRETTRRAASAPCARSRAPASGAHGAGRTPIAD